MTSAEQRLEGRLRSGLREVAESVTFDEGTGFVPTAPRTATPTWRRHRTLVLATASVSLVLLVGVVAVIIRSAQTARNVNVNPIAAPATDPNAQSLGRSFPIATEKIFPGLAHVLQSVRGYEHTDGPVAYGEIVATTRDRVSVLFGIQPNVDKHPVDVVRLVGTFTCNTCSTPPRAVVPPQGSEILFASSRVTGVPVGMFQIGNGPTDLAQFGRVYRLPGVGSVSPPTLTSPTISAPSGSFGYSPPVTRAAAIETVKRDRAEIAPGAAFAAKLVGAPATPTWLVEVHGRFRPMNAGVYTWGEFTINAITGAVLDVSASNSPLGTWTAEIDQLAGVG